MNNNLEIKSVCKALKGKKILNNINMSLFSNHIYGLMGHNGSGKTMILRTIAGLMKPDSGEILYNNKVIYKDMDFIPKLGLIIENISLFSELSAIENLNLLAKINNYISYSEVIEALERIGLDADDRRPIKKYSLGMKQKLTIAQAIMERPEIILFDEPTNALDEESVLLFYKICKEEAKRGAIVLIASHSKDINNLCSQTFIVENGKIIQGEFK